MTRSLAAGSARGVVIALVAGVMFAVNSSVSKVALGEGGLQSTAMVQIRSLGAATCLMAFCIVRRPAQLRAGRRELAFLLAVGVVGIGLVQWFYFVAIDRLPVGIALLLEFLAPVFVVVWVRFVRKEPVRARVWAALTTCVVGLAVVTEVWGGVELDGVGVLAGLGAALALTVYFLSGERGLGNRDALTLAAWTFTASALFWAVVRPPWTFPWAQLGDAVELPSRIGGTAPLWVLVAWVVVLGTVVPYAMVMVALATLGSARYGVIGMIEPVLAGVAAWVLLGETLTGAQLVGGAIVLVGIVLAETARRRPTGSPGQAPELAAP